MLIETFVKMLLKVTFFLIERKRYKNVVK